MADVNEYHTVIDFDEHGTRKFVTSLVALEPTQIAAPERRVAKASRKGVARARARD